MDLATTEAFNVAEVERAADSYRISAKEASDTKDRLDNEILANMRKQLSGLAFDEAEKELKQISSNFHYIQVECSLVSVALNSLAFDMRRAKTLLQESLGAAESAGFKVHSDGAVGYPESPSEGNGAPSPGGTVRGSSEPSAHEREHRDAEQDSNPHRLRALAISNDVVRALTAASKADAKWGSKIRTLKADDDLTVSAHDWADVKNDSSTIRRAAGGYLDKMPTPPKDGTAKENSDWWKGLTEEERAAYIATQPAAVGAMDGLPSPARDEANRVVFNETRAKYKIELDNLPPEPPKYKFPNGPNPEWFEWRDRKNYLEGRAEGMDSIQARFDDTGRNGLPEAYLLGFHDKGMGDGRVIMATGNPDTADHIAVYVPGSKTDLPGIGGDLDRSNRLWEESHAMSPNSNVSTITWFDYNAPDTVVPGVDGDIVPEASNHEYAQEGAPGLNEFMSGVEQSQGGADESHTTLIGHSYGSTVIGEASKQGDLATDDIVVAGSPGMQTDHADNLDVPNGHVWSMLGSDDIVDDMGRSTGLGDNNIVPSDEEFGANRVTNDAVEHGDYWNEDSQSLRNQARIITGEYDEVPLE